MDEEPTTDEPRIKYLGRMLINTSDYWTAIDGKRYNVVWGPTWAVVAKDVIGVNPGGGHAAFILQVGRIKPLIIAGCRVHYCQLCEERPAVPDALFFDEPDVPMGGPSPENGAKSPPQWARAAMSVTPAPGYGGAVRLGMLFQAAPRPPRFGFDLGAWMRGRGRKLA